MASQHLLSVARRALEQARERDSKQAAYELLLEAERRCTRVIHAWLASTMELEPTGEPRVVLSLDVDGVLEDNTLGFSSSCLTGVAALRLLQLGRTAVVLNTARSIIDVRQRVAQFRLVGGVGAFGAVIWDGVFDREEDLLGEVGRKQLAKLRQALTDNDSIVLDPSHRHTVRASSVISGELVPIPGLTARRLLTELSLPDLSFWVAPRYTDFVDRTLDKGAGVARLRQALGLQELPLAAIGDSACDVPMLRAACLAFAAAATIPGYSSPRGQRYVRCRHIGAEALWEAACQLVPAARLQRQVRDSVSRIALPAWLPNGLGGPPGSWLGLRPRLAAAFALRRMRPHATTAAPQGLRRT
jgi:hypothetical protein